MELQRVSIAPERLRFARRASGEVERRGECIAQIIRSRQIISIPALCTEPKANRFSPAVEQKQAGAITAVETHGQGPRGLRNVAS